MLYAIARELGAALQTQGVPFPVIYSVGAERSNAVTFARERIVFEEVVGEKGDQVNPPKAIHPNPTMPAVCVDAARIRIFARSALAGAAEHDHTERARIVRDHVIAALDAIVRGRKNTITFGRGGLMPLDDGGATAEFSGALYELDIAIDRGVFRETWKGEAQEEVTIGTDVTIANIAKVSQATGAAGTPPGNAETASGG